MFANGQILAFQQHIDGRGEPVEVGLECPGQTGLKMVEISFFKIRTPIFPIFALTHHHLDAIKVFGARPAHKLLFSRELVHVDGTAPVDEAENGFLKQLAQGSPLIQGTIVE